MTKLAVVDTTVHKTYEWLRDVRVGLGFDNERAAYAALRATLHGIRDLLPTDQVAQLGAQLPMLVRGLYYEGWNPVVKRDRQRQDFLGSVAHELHDHLELRDTVRVTRVVLAALGSKLSPGEARKIMDCLPREVRELWAAAPPSLPKEGTMRVREIMSQKVEWVSPDITVHQAACKMRDDDIGCLPVGENDRLVGMVTDRDIACRADAAGRSPDGVKVREVMSSGVVYCFDDDDVKRAATLMEEKQFTGFRSSRGRSAWLASSPWAMLHAMRRTPSRARSSPPYPSRPAELGLRRARQIEERGRAGRKARVPTAPEAA